MGNTDTKITLIGIYRDRPKGLEGFMKYVVPKFKKRFPTGRVVIIEQSPEKEFNRGKLRNIGYLVSKDSEFLLFHDIGPYVVNPSGFVLPKKNEVMHLWGHKHCLGGIYIIRADDYERSGGHPNRLWKWGQEDIIFQKRLENAGITVNKSIMIPRHNGEVVEIEGFTNTEGFTNEFMEQDLRFRYNELPDYYEPYDNVQNVDYDIVKKNFITSPTGESVEIITVRI